KKGTKIKKKVVRKTLKSVKKSLKKESKKKDFTGDADVLRKKRKYKSLSSRVIKGAKRKEKKR
ncbi:hypothetical protein Tco_0369743, partial [Tanacetum coccineum]